MSIRGNFDCPFCNGTGYVTGSWGTQTLCKCVIEQMNNTGSVEANIEEPVKTIDQLNSDSKIQKLIKTGVISLADEKLEYNREYALTTLTNRCNALHLKISKTQVQDCLDTMDSILATISAGHLPKKSYAIGAENGIGKTTFAITIIKSAALNNMKVVPYIDMTALAEKYVDYARELRKSRESIDKGTAYEMPGLIKKFEWRDYIEADIVVTSLTGGNEDIAYAELDTLLTLLMRRSVNRKPTIVLMRTPVEYYLKFDDVRRYLIKEVFAPSGQDGTYAILERHSMYTREPVEVQQ